MSVTTITDKIICPCGSSIKNASTNIKQHQQSAKHQNYIKNLYVGVLPTFVTEIITEKENVADNKEMVTPTTKSANAIRVASYRAKQKAKLGDDAYKEKMRTDRKGTRIATKAKADIKVIEEGGVVSEPSKKQTKEDVALYVGNLLSDLDTQKVYNKPAVVQLVKKKIERFDTKQGAITNCDQLVAYLDKSNLVSDRYGQIKPKTIRIYLKNINLVHRAMTGKEFDCSDFEWTRDIAKVEETINTMPKERKGKDGVTETQETTKRQRFTALKSILERLDGFTKEAKAYKKLQDTSQGIISQTGGENKLSTREKTNWMNWDDIVDYDDEEWDDEDRLIHGLYTLIPPRRLEYGLLKLAKKKGIEEAQKMDTKFNYIVTDKKSNTPSYIVLNRYKTDYKYHQYTINLSAKNAPLFNYAKLKYLIKEMMDNTKEVMKNNEPFFVNRDGGMYVNETNDTTSFGQRINSVFNATGKKISCNIMRHSFVTDFLGDKTFNSLNNNTLKTVSQSLGHSAEMFQYYRRVDTNLTTGEARVKQFLKDEKAK